jgi:hypothetical protein
MINQTQDRVEDVGSRSLFALCLETLPTLAALIPLLHQAAIHTPKVSWLIRNQGAY